MAENRWTWAVDGDRPTVTLGEKTWKARDVNPAELRDYSEALQTAKGVFETLHRARQSFETGAADYTKANERLRVLVAEYRIAETTLEHLVGEIEEFFEPGGLVVEVAGKGLDAGDHLRGFIREALQKLSRKPEKEEVPNGS